MTRVAYVCADPGIPIPGTKGAAIHVQSVCRAFRHWGVDGEIFAASPQDSELEQMPVHTITAPSRRKRKSVEDRECRLFLSRIQDSTASAGDFDFIYERYSLWHVGGIAFARERNIPLVLEVNSPLPIEASRYRQLANASLADGIAQLLLRNADAVVCVSDEVADWVCKKRGHEHGVASIPNGVDELLFQPTPQPENHPPTLVFAGSFRPWHGIDQLLDVFSALVRDHVPSARLLCIGDGPELAPFLERVKEKGFEDRVQCTGQVAHAEVPTLLGQANVAIAPYPDLEGFYFSPLKIFEFMAMGLPVVSSAIGQIPKIVTAGEHGLLCPAGDTSAMACAVAELLKDSKRARQLGMSGRQWIESNATWRHRTRQILDLVDSVL